MLIDIGTCLQDTPDERVNRSILQRATEFNVGKFLCSGVSPEDWSLVHSIVRQEEKIIPFFGIHPWYVDRVSPTWHEQLLHIVSVNMGAGIGTIGLDRSPSGGDYEKQKNIFLSQIQLAGRLSRPIAIHCAGAWDDLLIFLRDNKAPRTRFMIHAYQENSGTLEQLLALGAYISFSRKTLLNAETSVLGVVKNVPKDRLLLETNFPYLNSGKAEAGASADTYFKCLRETYALAAKAIGMDEEELQSTIWNNSLKYLSGELPSKKKSK